MSMFSRQAFSAKNPTCFDLRSDPRELVLEGIKELIEPVKTLLKNPQRNNPNNLQALECLTQCKAAVEHLYHEHEDETTCRPPM